MEEKLIDMEYSTKYLSRKLGISTDIIQILYSELEYLTGLGLLVEELSSSKKLEKSSVVYKKELINYITIEQNSLKR